MLAVPPGLETRALSWLPAVLCLAFLAVLLGRPRGAAAGVAKVAASASFVAFGLASGLLGAGTVGLLGLAGLALGAVGDVALLSRERRPFLAGLLAFLLAHLAYVGAFLALGVAPWAVLVAGAVLAVAAARVWRWLGGRVGQMRPAVLAYVVVITAMVAVAAGCLAHAPSQDRIGLLLAAVLFYVSDLFVARERFVVSDPLNRRVGLPLYYFAQLGFADLLAST